MTETVTISQAEYDALHARIEDLEDLLLIAERRQQPSVPLSVAKRLLGDGPLLEYKGVLATYSTEDDGTLSGVAFIGNDVVHFEAPSEIEISEAFRESVEAYIGFRRERAAPRT